MSHQASNLIPLYDRVIIKPSEDEKTTKSGIVIPDSVKGETPQVGEIIAVGPGKVDNNGKTQAMHVKVGDKVIFGKYSGDEVEMEGTKYKILHEDSIFAIVK